MEFNFGPKDYEEEIVFAQEYFRVNIQCALQTLLNKNDITYEYLAHRLNKSRDEIDSFFESEWNPTIREVAAIFYAISFKTRIDPKFVEFW